MPVYDDPIDARAIDAAALQGWTATILERIGTPPDIAADVAEVLLSSDRRGIASHGTARLPQYAALVEAGVLEPAARPTIERDRPALVLMDANNGWGHHASRVGVDVAIERARSVGSCTVVVRNSNHYGIAGWYALRAARQGLIGVSMTNSSPLVAPTRSRVPMLGTNPIAVAAPAGRYDAFCLDMATSTVPRGRIEVAARRGWSLPVGWAIDVDGNPATTPEAALSGALHPLGGAEATGGYKGYGLALVVDMLTGILGGAAFGPNTVSLFSTHEGPADLGETFMVIDPAAVDDPGAFEARMEILIGQLMEAPTAPDAPGPVLIPGAPEAAAERLAERRGVVIDREHHESLMAMGDRMGVPLPARARPGAAVMGADRADICVVGGGILGLATALRLLEARPELRVVILEKEPTLAAHQTGHNSGVLHAGLYYQPGSLKARLCREGKAQLEDFCAAHDIPIERTGKLVVMIDDEETERFAALKERAIANSVEGIEEVGPERLREIEPHAAGKKALWSPGTGIVDYLRVALAYADEVRAKGGVIETSRAVTSITQRGDEMVVGTSGGDLIARRVIACAGLWADRVAAMTGEDSRSAPRIVPFRGDYYTLTPDARQLVRGLIYPVADPRFPFLGIHLTRRIDGNVLAGPNAVLAFKREGYRRRDLSVRDLAGALAYPGFLRLATKYWRTGMAEQWRDWSKRSFLAAVQRYVPDIRGEQLVFGPSGVRAQALARDGSMVDDFLLGGSDRVLHVRNAPSPAATSSLAVGRVLAEEAVSRFGL